MKNFLKLLIHNLHKFYLLLADVFSHLVKRFLDRFLHPISLIFGTVDFLSNLLLSFMQFFNELFGCFDYLLKISLHIRIGFLNYLHIMIVVLPSQHTLCAKAFFHASEAKIHHWFFRVLETLFPCRDRTLKQFFGLGLNSTF